MSETAWAKYLREKKRADEAEAEVERLQAEIDEKQVQLNRWIVHDIEKQREVERLRAALEDIVRFGDEVPHGFEAHDLQAIARAALAKGPGQRVVHEYGDALDALAKEEK